MNENRVKRILREGGLALGTHVGGIADLQIVELVGLAGFDAAFIDMEHTTFDLHDVQLAVMAAERVAITPIVRTPGFDPAFILRPLDMGVQGIQVPNVSDAATARDAVQAVRYPPLGDRGMAAGSRAAEFGSIPLVEHMAQSNREILLACMIEDMAAVERIDEIAAVKGLICWQSSRPICRARSASVASPITRGWSRRSTGSATRSRKAPACALHCR
jgi:2-keto-3-deoxy-L-rhamnonate aldolase RhmA